MAGEGISQQSRGKTRELVDREVKNKKNKMKGKPGTRATIPPGSRAHIEARAVEHPYIQRKELAKELQNELEEMGYDIPKLEVLERMISKHRNDPINPKDKPFCLCPGALVKYPIHPEALPMVLRVWANRLEEAKEDKDGFSIQWTFTIREALWVARLSGLYSLFDDPEAIWGYAFWYSVRERAYEAIGEAIDTIDLDAELLKNFKPTPTENKRKRKGGKSK